MSERDKAIERVRKLRALADPARGGTPAERETAAFKAADLIDRLGITAAEIDPPAPRVPAPVAPPWAVRNVRFTYANTATSATTNSIFIRLG